MECQVRIVGWSDAVSPGPWTMKILQPEGALDVQNHIGRGKDIGRATSRKSIHTRILGERAFKGLKVQMWMCP